MKTLTGTGVSEGLALGRIVWYGKSAPDGAALTDFDSARKIAAEEFEKRAAGCGSPEMAALYESYLLMLEDSDLEDGVRKKTSAGADPAAAVRETGEELAAMLLALEDEYMRARAEDVRSVSRRLSDIMCGKTFAITDFDAPIILAASDLTPADTVGLDAGSIAGVLLAGGSANGHTAILAQLMGIPAVIGLGNSLGPGLDGLSCAVDGKTGAVTLEPDSAFEASFRAEMKMAGLRKDALKQFASRPAETSRGQRIKVMCNIGSAADAEAAAGSGCDGIGLFRTEFLYLDPEGLPGEEKQFEAYKKTLQLMEGKEVIIRTCDIGSDKKADHLQLPAEENPALGLRGIRLSLAREEMFLTQLRALLRASVYGRLSVMFPMITSLDEFKRAKALWKTAMDRLSRENVPFDAGVPLGAMIETPAAAIISGELAGEADFFSIGTNDLTQYTLAADRQSPDVAALFDPGHPAVKKLIEMTARAAAERGIPVGICGNSAADPELLEFYINAGIGELSVSPGRALSLKRDICSL
ncbi:MAG: phosphoenolpyruvate--protein phosphotransferase [Abditibacteriota bacterium]|nr:phosphoenolpyruvate--protein phosphotransferase [Abditibacteriota bacterium]